MKSETCDAIASMRKKIQRIDKNKVLFLDEVAIKLNEAQNYTIVLPGEKPNVIATDTTSYSKRYDMIACCNGEQVLPPIIFSPKDRLDQGVRGITKKILERGVDDVLAQAFGALDKYPLSLIVDKASIHSKDIIQVFHDRGCQDLQQVQLMPTQAAKRLSPLDNALFHIFQERVRKHAPLTEDNVVQIMSNEWNNISSHYIQSQYRKCGLVGYTNPYFDCPAPALHQHKK
ncbi:MAG TPA: hypothetical protein VLE02_04325 [Nitrosarchaeum sp.]|nr:hypothetical protein [Nitrosarchaeum sp.]